MRMELRASGEANPKSCMSIFELLFGLSLPTSVISFARSLQSQTMQCEHLWINHWSMKPDLAGLPDANKSFISRTATVMSSLSQLRHNGAPQVQNARTVQNQTKSKPSVIFKLC